MCVCLFVCVCVCVRVCEKITFTSKRFHEKQPPVLGETVVTCVALNSAVQFLIICCHFVHTHYLLKLITGKLSVNTFTRYLLTSTTTRPRFIQ